MQRPFTSARRLRQVLLVWLAPLCGKDEGPSGGEGTARF